MMTMDDRCICIPSMIAHTNTQNNLAVSYGFVKSLKQIFFLIPKA